MNFSTPYCPAFPILVCNQGCEYCINHASPDADLNYKLEPAEKWVAGLNNLDNVNELNFCGGEPTLHPGMADIVNGLRPFGHICLGSNGSERAAAMLLKIRPRKDFGVSLTFHPTQTTFDKFAENYRQIAAVHPTGVSYVVHPNSEDETKKWQGEFAKLGVGLGLLGFRGWGKDGKFYPWTLEERSGSKKRSKAVCHFDFCTPVGPDGKVYACHYFMYIQATRGIIGDIFANQMTYPKTMLCEDYGFCNPCEEARTIVPIP